MCFCVGFVLLWSDVFKVDRRRVFFVTVNVIDVETIGLAQERERYGAYMACFDVETEFASA